MLNVKLVVHHVNSRFKRLNYFALATKCYGIVHPCITVCFGQRHIDISLCIFGVDIRLLEYSTNWKGANMYCDHKV